MKIWARLFLTLALLAGGTALAYWQSELFQMEPASSVGAAADLMDAGKGGISIEPGPCDCPPGHGCFPNPRVGFVSPARGDTFQAGETTDVVIYACDLHLLPGGTGSPLDYTTNLSITCPGIDLETDEPSVSITPQLPGTCELLVQGFPGNFARAKSSSVQATLSIPVVSAAPSVTLTSPLQNHVYVEGNLVTLSANASDSDGSVVSVTFEVRNQSTQALVFSHVDSSAPYGVNMPNIAAGAYVAIARALDNDGNISEASVQFSAAAANIAPTVSIASPVASSFPAPATLTFEASASDADGSVVRVDFELLNTARGGAPLTSSDSIPPYTFSVASLAASSYVLNARAHDNAGASTLATKTFTVDAAPTAQVQMLDAPGAPHIAGGSLKLLATATVPTGSIQSVQFFLRTGSGPYTYTALGSGTVVGVNTWEYNWSPVPGGVPAGQHVVLAYATPTTGIPQWSNPRQFVVAANVEPSFVAGSEKPKRLADYDEVGPLGNTFKSFLGNVFEPGQQMELKAEFNDINRNIRRIEYYLLTAGEGATAARLLATQNYSVPHAQTRYSFQTRINVTAEMVRDRMQRVYAIAIDDRGATARSTDAPVAIRASNNLTQACLPSGLGCTGSPGQVHRVPGSFSASWYDAQVGQTRGIAGESYFDTRFLSVDQQNYTTNARGDEVSFQCPQGAHWAHIGSNCAIRSREVGTYQTYQLHFDQAGAFDLKLCFANTPQAQASSGAGSEFGQVVHMQFEATDASGSWVTEAHGHISDGGSASGLARAAAEQGFSVPNTCPTELRTVSILNAYGEPVTWPAGYRTRMRLVSTEALSGDLIWLALTPSSGAGPTRFVVSSPVEGQVFPVTNGTHPTVTLNTDLVKPHPARPGGTVDYWLWSRQTGVFGRLPGDSLPADGNRTYQLTTSPDLLDPTAPYRVSVQARLQWEDRDYYTPERSFYVSDGARHQVEWIGDPGSAAVRPGDVVPFTMRAKFAPIGGAPEVRLLVQNQATAQVLIVAAQPDFNAQGCPQGWQCFQANWTVPAYESIGSGSNQPAETVFQVLAEARSGQDWATGKTAEPRIYRRAPRSGSEPILAMDTPTQGSWLQANASAPLRATISATGSIAMVAFQRCLVDNPTAQMLQCASSGWQSVGSQPVLVSSQWETTHQTGSVSVGEARHYLYQVRAQVSGVVRTSPPVHVIISDLPPNQPPVVVWSAPAQGVPLGVGQAVELAVTATDPEGPVQSVEFRASRNGVLAWTAAGTVDPADSKRWTHRWIAPESGTWAIVARARDANLTLPGEASAQRSFTVVSVPGIAHETPAEVPSTVAPASDGVGATAGTFRVDETGSATYSIPLAVVPGRAGVAPEMALSYSSQGGMGVMGRGWSISGASAITRCRQTAEAGDAAALASGSPPLSFDSSDRYCLDGQRLMLVAGSYAPNAASMEFRTEIDSFARIRAFNTDGVNGPNYFVVQAKDGTTSWYGDSINREGLPFLPTTFTTEERTDAALRRNDGSGVAPAANAPVLAFALARRMDSFGNFIDYRYDTNQEQGEQVLSLVEYTGKVQLNGQATASQPAFAALRFNYENLPVTQARSGWQAGMRVRSTKRLASVDSLANLSEGQVIRQYRLGYGTALPISGESVLSELRECSGAAGDAVCYQPTRFGWNPGTLAMDQLFNPNLVNYTREHVKGHQLGDIDGDGLMDLVWFDNRSATPGHCPAGLPWETQRIWTGFGGVTRVPGPNPLRPEEGALDQFDLEVGSQRHACSLRSYPDLPGAWFLQDYNADGRDDLWLADKPPAAGQINSWQIYPSNGRSTTEQVFNQSGGLLTTCPQNDPDAANCLPVNSGNNLLMQLADVNGDGLLDAVYGSPSNEVSSPEGNIIRIKLMERSGSSFAFSRAYSVRLNFNGQLADCATAGQGPGPSPGSAPWLRECRVRFEDPSSRWGRAPNPIDLNGDGRGDLLLLVEKVYEELCPINTPNCWIPRPIEAGEQASSFWIPSSEKQLEALIENAQAPPRSSQVAESTRSYHLAAVVESIDASNRRIQLAPYHQWESGLEEPNGTNLRYRFDASPADLNGDGLMDLIWSSTREDQVNIDLNTGDGFIPLQTLTGIHGRDYLRVLDFDADGRADLVYPSGSGSGSFWQMRRGLADGGVSISATNLPLFERAGDPSSRLGLNPQRGAFFFADMDGDGRTDYLDVPMGPDGGLFARLLRTSPNGYQGAGRFKPLAHINTITNGYGAVTEITYQPLTNGAVYLREPGSRAESDTIGNGSPVQDLLGGMYVVSRVASDAPGLGNPGRKSELLYQYRGARMQAGGRGMLGFREVRTIDANFDPGTGGALNHIVSITEYGLAANDPETGVVRYGFPYIGMPRESRQYRVNGAVPSGLRNCLVSGPEQTSGYCFNASGLAGNPNGFFNEPSGTLLSYARNRLAHAVTVTGIAGERSVFPYIQASFEAKGNPEGTGVTSLSETVSLFNYQTAWGDLANSEVSTASGASYSGLAALRDEAVARAAAQTPDARCPSARCVTRVGTVNTWLPTSQPTATNDRNYWRLGRLDKSRVTHWRQGAHGEPASSLTRESRFQYELGSAARTGALTVESVAGLLTPDSATAPDNSSSSLRTVRKRDAYGNVTDTFVCSGDVSITDCDDPNKVKQRTAGQGGAPLTRVHRHTRTEYDADGRYPLRTLAPHYHASIEAGVLHASESVVARDALGNVTRSERHARLQRNSQIDAWTTATYGPLGRQHRSTDSTGAESVSEFHWCAGNGISGQVAACPSDIGAVFRQTSYALGGTRSVTYFDRLGREVFALSEGFNRYDENAANDWVGVCKTYDGRGRTVAVTEPFFVGNVAISGLRPELSTAVGCASKASTRTTYDVLDRAVTIRLPEDIGGTTHARTEMVYQGLSTTTLTYLSRATTPFQTPEVVELSEVKEHDPTGMVLTVIDAEGLEAKYAHDAAGNLVALKRNAGNGEIVSRIGYDALGRKTSQNDPDAGTASYAYNAAGELICSQDARGYATITDFDALGRSWRTRTQSNGCPAPTPHAEVPATTVASALTGQFPGTHASVDVTVYDLAANGVGQVASSVRRHRVGLNYAGYGDAANPAQGLWAQEVTYDQAGRPFKTVVEFKEPSLSGSGLNDFDYTQITTYDALGRVETTMDATGGVVENMYSAHGFLRRVRDYQQPSLVYWELLETDVRGQTSLDRRHGKVELTQKREYNEVTGRLARIATGRLSNGEIINPVQKLAYVFDAQGNLLSRRDERSSSSAEHLTETFVYDSLNRLTLARAALGVAPMPNQGFETMSLAYDKLGNICRKGTTHYQYKDARSGCQADTSTTQVSPYAGPHAVTRRDGLQYTYDAAGNMTNTFGHDAGSGTGATVRSARFDGAGNADRLSINTQSTSFWYAGGGRYLRLDQSDGAQQKLTRYAGSVEWIVRAAGDPGERRRNIGGFLLLTETGSTLAPTRKYRYLLTDHLGSTDTLVDENGVVVERMSFDAHGSRRVAASGTGMWASLLPAVAANQLDPVVNAETTRGFTGHEHVDRMGLIHMNGRLYDPLLGRMLSPDPIVQEPYNAQNLNRYSYVLNNPLSYTDPSGLSFVKKYWRQIVAIAISVFVPVLAPTFAASFWGAVAIGFTSGVVATGSLEGGLWGAFGAGIFHGIGIGFESVGAGNGANFDGVFNTNLTGPQFAGQVLSHATAGGVISVMQGGKFGHGFASAGISKAAGPATANAPNDFVRAGVHALIGGTASAASGGKFANGAITAAMAFAFNEAASALRAGRTRSLAGEAGLGGSEDFAGGWFSGDHEYNMANKICDISERCTLSRVYETSSTVLPAPANYLHATPDPNVTVWQIRSRVMFGTTLGKVYVSRDPSNFSHTNFTTEDHAARYGAVHRTVFQRDGAIWIHTRGVGSGMMPAINNILGRLEFDMLDERLRNAFN